MSGVVCSPCAARDLVKPQVKPIIEGDGSPTHTIMLVHNHTPTQIYSLDSSTYICRLCKPLNCMFMFVVVVCLQSC